MIGIDDAVLTNDQPIGGGESATIFGETLLLTDWITPGSIDIQEQYTAITQGLASIEDKIMACLRFVASYRYKRFVKTTVKIEGVTFTQNDTWLMPAQALASPVLNCANRSFLLTSLLRQAMSPSEVFSVIGNLNVDHQDGHAWNMVRLGTGDYLLEPTEKVEKVKLIPVAVTEPQYEDVLFFNDGGVKEVPGRNVREPLSQCFYCIPFLSDYVNTEQCYNL